MTNKNLEERTESKMKSIKRLMENPTSGIEAQYAQCLAIYKQNQIIIDYLQELYKNKIEESK